MTLKDHLTSIFDVFSRRSKPRFADSGADEVSERLRNRILLLLRDVLSGKWPKNRQLQSGDYTQDFWEEIAQSLQHLYGRPKLSNAHMSSAPEDALAFIYECEPIEFLDFVELVFKADCLWRVLHERGELVDAINEIFRIESAPYRLTPFVTREEEENGPYGSHTLIHTVSWPTVLRFEEEVTHAEAVLPALSILAGPDFEVANLEFRDALEEYKKGHYGDCLTKCCSAFESVMKIVCNQNGWPFDDNRDGAAFLLKTIVSKSSLESFFEHPLMLIATIRNRLSSSHGGGSAARNVRRHVAQFAITSTAAGIVLLVQETATR